MWGEVSFDTEFPELVADLESMGREGDDLAPFAANLAQVLEAEGPTCVCDRCARELEERYGVGLIQATDTFAATMARTIKLYLNALEEAARDIAARTDAWQVGNLHPALMRLEQETQRTRDALRKIGKPVVLFEFSFASRGEVPFVLIDLTADGGIGFAFLDYAGVLLEGDCACPAQFDLEGNPFVVTEAGE
ncbi:hypothetical protein [Paludisphaera soli]|uniref:hypothetical protein n=1 Tax=Paludisphaera soli TaxID=2712865 RepID=UPI0013ED0FC4|nr:hypothetical protein [Paludisphaera soli]